MRMKHWSLQTYSISRNNVKPLLDNWKHIYKKAAETAESVLSEAASKKRYEVHISPKYLIPDTNCYVDLLPSIKRLVDTNHFTIAVPLTVLAELEGLSKGSLEPSLKQNASRTTSGAKAAVEFIKSAFSNKASHVKALTTQGSLMSSISFRAEVTGKASNDDHILQSCLNPHSKIDKLKANQTCKWCQVSWNLVPWLPMIQELSDFLPSYTECRP